MIFGSGKSQGTDVLGKKYQVFQHFLVNIHVSRLFQIIGYICSISIYFTMFIYPLLIPVRRLATWALYRLFLTPRYPLPTTPLTLQLLRFCKGFFAHEFFSSHVNIFINITTYRDKGVIKIVLLHMGKNEQMWEDGKAIGLRYYNFLSSVGTDGKKLF